MKPIPVLLVAGFLGSGKTTLMRRLILDARLHGLRAAVVVNEFGIEDVDSHILKQADAELLASISGGCACCSGQDELHWALLEMGSRPPEEVPDVILMEASGLADPVVLLDVLTAAQLLPVLRLGAIVTVVDAVRFGAEESAAPTGVGSLLQRQIQLSGFLVLNKADLVTEEGLQGGETVLRQINGHADLLRAVQCDLDFTSLWATVLNGGAKAAPQPGSPIADSEPNAHAVCQTVACPLPHPVERARLEAALQGLSEEVWRAKGFLRLRGEAGLFLLQYTGGPGGGRYTIGPFYLSPMNDEPATSLVFIGAELHKDRLMRDFAGIGSLLSMI